MYQAKRLRYVARIWGRLASTVQTSAATKGKNYVRKSLCLFVRTTFLRLKNFSKSNKAFDKKEKKCALLQKAFFRDF